ncbi:tRNA (cytidine32/guanosine34-2'-O)-methyltransferase [Nematocida major]|uniref:tRNA (cytidine32/guanosine34-2'-O)-methyltransferase n=1 Tax=Nematocida major TaxID=1912982 RepID=UPI0020082E5C|nr:tRNA (cytidine32/guanosine34-2'-O)-methyltransferase [Nematocida major]KAH9385901.1 tRNA (cytidine32/guanosine34-2'-O)-methyltransferase [Nematocida major]
MERDVFYRRAKSDGFRARSAYKLLEILHSHEALRAKSISRVVDLCAAPGSWSQVVKQEFPHAKLVAVDLQDIEPVGDAVVIKGDITEKATIEKIVKIFPEKVDLILCDGAPEVTGLHDLDEYFHSALIQASCGVCVSLLENSGFFVVKVFTGEAPDVLLAELQEYFESVSLFKPKSSRYKSKEAFAICTGVKCRPSPTT